MDEIFSVRIDRRTKEKIKRLAKLKKWSKKKLLQKAIESLEQEEVKSKNSKESPFDKSFGTWKHIKGSTEDYIQKNRDEVEEEIRRKFG